MFRNEEELINSLFHKLNGKNESRPAPLTSKELNEIEEYRDNDGFIDLTHVKSFTELQRLIELVDRKNHLEELDSQETTSLQDTVTDLIAELLPIIGVDKANLKLNTPEGKATVEVVKGEKPKVVYDLASDGSAPSLSYNVECEQKDNSVNLDDVCSSYECETCPYTNRCIDEVSNVLKDCGTSLEEVVANPDLVPNDEKTEGLLQKYADSPMPEVTEQSVLLVSAGGAYNPLFENAVAYICELEHFQGADVYTMSEELPEKIDTYVLLPNAFGKIFQAAAEAYSDILAQSNADVYMIDPETFELVRITNPFDLFDFAMTEAQEDALRF